MVWVSTFASGVGRVGMWATSLCQRWFWVGFCRLGLYGDFSFSGLACGRCGEVQSGKSVTLPNSHFLMFSSRLGLQTSLTVQSTLLSYCVEFLALRTLIHSFIPVLFYLPLLPLVLSQLQCLMIYYDNRCPCFSFPAYLPSL